MSFWQIVLYIMAIGCAVVAIVDAAVLNKPNFSALSAAGVLVLLARDFSR